MADYRIRNVDKGGNHTKHITFVGGFGEKGWKVSVAFVVNDIERRNHRYYVEDAHGNKAFVMVYSYEGKKYIRTRPDDTPNDNLLALPPIPVGYELIG